MALFPRKWRYLLILSGLILILILVLFYSDRGLFHLRELQAEKESLEQANERLRKENRKLMRRIERIKSDDRYIEDEARKKLGLVRPDETIYELKEESEQNRSGEK